MAPEHSFVKLALVARQPPAPRECRRKIDTAALIHRRDDCGLRGPCGGPRMGRESRRHQRVSLTSTSPRSYEQVKRGGRDEHSCGMGLLRVGLDGAYATPSDETSIRHEHASKRRCTDASSISMDTGLSQKSSHTAVSPGPGGPALVRMTGIRANSRSSFRWRQSSIPSMIGIDQSVMTRSGFSS